MEYLIGAMVAMAAMYFSNTMLSKRIKQEQFVVRRTQSYLYKLLTELSMLENIKQSKPKQSDKYLNRHHIKVMILEDKAYWIKDNQLYVADMIDGQIDGNSSREVDTIAMDHVELEHTMFVVEKLTEDDDNDYRSTGQQ